MEIKNATDLNAAIAEMENKRTIQEVILKQQYLATIEHYKPKNLVKSAFSNALQAGGAGSTILKAASGIGAGLLAKNLVFGNATSLVGKLINGAVKMGATKAAINNKDKIAAWGIAIYKNLFTKKSKNIIDVN